MSNPRNYTPALFAALRDMPPKPGSVEVVNIQHDDYCGIFRGLGCNCAPVIVRICK